MEAPPEVSTEDIDDAPVGSSTAYTDSGSFTVDLLPYDIARIEVLRGPQGTLFGSGSLSGTVRYITGQPELAEVDAGEPRAGVVGGTLQEATRTIAAWGFVVTPEQMQAAGLPVTIASTSNVFQPNTFSGVLRPGSPHHVSIVGPLGPGSTTRSALSSNASSARWSRPGRGWPAHAQSSCRTATLSHRAQHRRRSSRWRTPPRRAGSTSTPISRIDSTDCGFSSLPGLVPAE